MKEKMNVALLEIKIWFLRQMAKLVAAIAGLAWTVDTIDIPMVPSFTDELLLFCIIALMIPVNAVLKEDGSVKTVAGKKEKPTDEKQPIPEVVEKPNENTVGE